MAKKSIRSASSLYRSKATSSSTQPGTPEATTSGNVQVLQYSPQATRRRRSLRPRRPSRVINMAVEGNIIPPVHSELVDTEPIQSKIKPKLRSKKKLKFKVSVEDEPQDPKVMKLGITGPKLKSTIRVIDPNDRDTSRIRILADVCYQNLLAFGDHSSSSDKS